MSSEKKERYECNNIKKCSFQPIVKSDPIKDLTYLVSQTFKPSYATFWNTGFPSAGPLSAFSFNATGVKTDDITISADGKTITVNTTGIYEISYHVSALFQNSTDIKFFVGIFINNINNRLANSGLEYIIPAPISFLCFPIDYSFQTKINFGDKIELRNIFINTLSTCDNIIPSLSINLSRIG